MEDKSKDIGIKIRGLGLKEGIWAYKTGIGQKLDRNWEAKSDQHRL